MQIINIEPGNNDQNIYVDSKIKITFDREIDPFTVVQGVSIYTITNTQWTGASLSVLDSTNSDILDPTSEFNHIKFNFTLDATGKILTIIPDKSLLPDKNYFIALFPGTDAERFLSAKTVEAPIIIPFDTIPSGTISILSPFYGEIDDLFIITFLNNNSFTFYRDSAGEETSAFLEFIDSEKIDLGSLSISISGQFNTGDQININTFKAVGLDNLTKNSFTTTHLEQKEFPASKRITTIDEYNNKTSELKIIGITPRNESINNTKINPITIRFNNNLLIGQDIKSKISIEREDIKTGKISNINYFYKIEGSSIKLFLLNME